MINYEEELKKFQPSLEVEDMADAIAQEDLTDLTDVLRDILSQMGICLLYTSEQPTRPLEDMGISCRTNCICPPGAKHKCTERRDIPGSTAFVPSVAGLIIAGEVVKDLTGKNTK